MPAPYYGVGCTHKFRTRRDDGTGMRKDGVVYDLTTATVKLILTSPTGVAVVKDAVKDDAVNGIASYTTVAGDLTAVGTWKRQWKVTDGGGTVILKAMPVSFQVRE